LAFAVVTLSRVKQLEDAHGLQWPPLRAIFVCAEHVRQLGGESPRHNVMDVK